MTHLEEARLNLIARSLEVDALGKTSASPASVTRATPPAYAGFTFTSIAASVAHYLAGDGALSLMPVAFLGLLAVSYVTRPANRRGGAEAILV